MFETTVYDQPLLLVLFPVPSIFNLLLVLYGRLLFCYAMRYGIKKLWIFFLRHSVAIRALISGSRGGNCSVVKGGNILYDNGHVDKNQTSNSENLKRRSSFTTLYFARRHAVKLLRRQPTNYKADKGNWE